MLDLVEFHCRISLSDFLQLVQNKMESVFVFSSSRALCPGDIDKKLSNPVYGEWGNENPLVSMKFIDL